MRSQGKNAAPKMGELDRPILSITTSWSRNPRAETCTGTSAGMHVAGGSARTNLRVKNSKGPSQREPYIWLSFTFRSSQWISEGEKNKTKHLLPAAGRERNCSETHHSILSSLTRPACRRNLLLEPKLLGYQKLTDLAEGNTQSSPL